MTSEIKPALTRLFSDYGMILVLFFLIGLFSLLTIGREEAAGAGAAEEMALKINSRGKAQQVVIITSVAAADIELSKALEEQLINDGHTVLKRINGDPPTAGDALRELESAQQIVDMLAVTKNVASWSLITGAGSKFSVCRDAEIIEPSSQKFPRFLKRDNLRNISDRISVIAILAIGMTMVIITAGIDLSAGSLIALSAVTCALFIREFGGDAEAGPLALTGCSFLAIAICGLMGFFSGALATTFKITPFIATLAMMMIARGLAYKFSNVTTIPINNESFAFLGKGRMAGITVTGTIIYLFLKGVYPENFG